MDVEVDLADFFMFPPPQEFRSVRILKAQESNPIK